MIQLFHVTKKYGPGAPALADVSLQIEKGEFVFLTGASGAGKTTLLRLIFRDEVPSSGQVLVRNESLASLATRRIPHLRRQIGVVFQDFKLLPRKTVFENVAYAATVIGLPPREQRRRTYQVLEMLGLNHRLHNFPAQISGGEQQRVAIARALVNRPLILLADEPTGNLDPELSREIMGLFKDINSHGTTVLIATHDRDLITRMARRTIALDHGRLVPAGAY
ncbi:MAG TPA: cell division ATP-binding protein FtsE [Candidatus Polarisedimenticolia bacterium]|nr:cell division ATP-binding protein FtsE [Candidatus Polarisedimenticolia bacterium]